MTELARQEGHSPMTHQHHKRVTPELPTRVTHQLPTQPVDNHTNPTKRVTGECQEGHWGVTPTRNYTRRDRSPREPWYYSLGADRDKSQTGNRTP